ncbi:hypothetical protein J0S82_000488 [Galemys pyrenaicus]|uniref:Uncharacterized protein n=1 Tax=Galemys pyrenaicus TaxID=202257 RepID=A0A8J6DMK6_GALPY|nr:hypothetical protein J0S82_000488 [Galemys pyrenaicus]
MGPAYLLDKELGLGKADQSVSNGQLKNKAFALKSSNLLKSAGEHCEEGARWRDYELHKRAVGRELGKEAKSLAESILSSRNKESDEEEQRALPGKNWDIWSSAINIQSPKIPSPHSPDTRDGQV